MYIVFSTWMSQEVRIKGDRISGLVHPNIQTIYTFSPSAEFGKEERPTHPEPKSPTRRTEKTTLPSRKNPPGLEKPSFFRE